MHIYQAKNFGPGFTLTEPERPEQERPPKDVARILAHFEANRPYYRLLIDLSMDPVTRFARLMERRPQPPIPVDLQPVGVAGMHLAFLMEHESTSPGDDELPISTVLSTPAGGTFVEVLEGATTITPAEKTTEWPRVALLDKYSMPWPTPIELPTVAGAGAADSKEAAKL